MTSDESASGLGHKKCSECYQGIVDLTGLDKCPDCGGEWR